MIREISHPTIDPAREAAFLQALEQARALLSRGNGLQGHAAGKGDRNSGPLSPACSLGDAGSAYRLVDFRESQACHEWRTRAGPFFTQPPRIDHSVLVIMGFEA